jgi:HSP20 family molecular chaperone IbpA
MGNLVRYQTADLSDLMEKISRNSIGLDSYFDQFFNTTVSSNYPPYNLVNVSNHESRLEIALAGFKKKEVKVYTEYGKLVVTGSREDKEESDYAHKGLAQRSFERAWTISDDSIVKDVVFEDGLLAITLGKVVPEHHARKDYL